MPPGGGSSKTVSTQELSPEQQELMGMVIPIARDYLDNIPKQFPGSTIAGFRGDEKAAQFQAKQVAGTAGDVASGNLNTLNTMQGGTPAGMAALTGLAGQAGQSGGTADAVRSTANPAAGAISGLSGMSPEFANQLMGFTQGAGAAAPTLDSLMGGAGAGLTGLRDTAGLAGNFGSNLAGASGQTGLGAEGLGQILGGYNDAGGARNFMLGGSLLDPATNPVLGAQIAGAVDPVFDRLEQTTLPGIASEFAGNNMFGSSRQGIAEGLATGQASEDAMNIAAQLQANNFNQGLGAMLSSSNTATSAAQEAGNTLFSGGIGAAGTGLNAASGAAGGLVNTAAGVAGDIYGTGASAAQSGLGTTAGAATGGLNAATTGRGQDLAASNTAANSLTNTALQALMASPEMIQLAMMEPGILGQVGQANRGMAQARLDERANRFTNEQMLPFLAAQDVANLAFGMGGGSATTSQSGGGGFDPLGTAMGVGQLGLLAYGLGAFSDRRLKRNITKVFRLGKNQWYRFRYHWSPKWHLGVMADEVPHAAVRVGAFDMVNYGRI